MDIVSTLTVTKGARIDNAEGRNCLGVFRAYDPQLGMDVALKEIDKKKLDVDKYFGEAQRMFESEHPNVVPIRTASQTADTILLVMPLYRNGSLKSRLASGPLSIGDTIRVGREVLLGIGAIHAGGSVHLDLKPSNILFGDNGTAKVADFGQARELGPDGFALRPDLMYVTITPPEAFVQSHVDRLADIYQVGVTLYQAVNGQAFFDEQLMKINSRLAFRDAVLNGKFPNRDKFLPHVPDRLRRAIRKAMCVDPAKRFQNAMDFASALTKVSSLNWSIQFLSDGSIRWDAPRNNQPGLCRIMRANGDLFNTEFYTVSSGKLRKEKSGLWTPNLKKKQAEEFLSQLF